MAASIITLTSATFACACLSGFGAFALWRAFRGTSFTQKPSSTAGKVACLKESKQVLVGKPCIALCICK